MRIFSIGCVVSCVFAVSPADAQSPPRRLTLVPDLQIDAKELGTQRESIVAIGPAGQIVLTARAASPSIRAFDSTGKNLGWKLPTGRRDEAEIMSAGAFGWIAGTNTMWVNDAGYRQVALVDSAGNVMKSIEHPSWIHPHWADRRKYPVFSRMQPWAVYKDETMLVLPGRARSLIDTPGFDRSIGHLLRMTWSGAIERTVSVLPPNEGSVVVQSKRCNHTLGVPMAARTIWSTSIDGMRIVSATPGVTAADSGTLRITALNERGDTVFTRRYRQPVWRQSKASVDAFLGNIGACGDISAEAIRDSAVRRVPEFQSTLASVTTGRDYTMLVMLRTAPDSGTGRGGLLLDPRGEVIGALDLPADHTVVGVDRTHLWALALGPNRAPRALVRFRIGTTAAPPSRTAPTAESSRPLRRQR